MFLKSVDASGLTKDSETLFQMFDEIVQEVGCENVVQFITDNDACYKCTGKKLRNKYGAFFWTLCLTHYIDLMLKNFVNPSQFSYH